MPSIIILQKQFPRKCRAPPRAFPVTRPGPQRRAGPQSACCSSGDSLVLHRLKKSIVLGFSSFMFEIKLHFLYIHAWQDSSLMSVIFRFFFNQANSLPYFCSVTGFWSIVVIFNKLGLEIVYICDCVTRMLLEDLFFLTYNFLNLLLLVKKTFTADVVRGKLH